MVKPIWQALSDLEIEGEYCPSAVDAVERVTTQLFQIVITDWEDQPEAAFLLKTARDLKAANRPLTLAIVSDGARLPEALKAGANSVLVKPIRVEQVRDTMRTACQLLRAKVQPSSGLIAPVATPENPVMAAAAAAGAGSRSDSSARRAEISFRAGEFLQSPSTAPGAQFDTESEVQKALDHVPVEELDALTNLEPMAGSVETAAVEHSPPKLVESQEALTGWVALQARLGKATPHPANDEIPRSQPLSYQEAPSAEEATVSSTDSEDAAKMELEESRCEAALFDYMSTKPEQPAQPRETHSKAGTLVLLGALAAILVFTIAVPRTREVWRKFYRTALAAGGNWLNPPPIHVAPVTVQHDSFAQPGDEYKLPMARSLPDMITDASQIHVLPVIDPTAKPEKGAETNNPRGPVTAVENSPDDPNASGQTPSPQEQVAGQDTNPARTGDFRENPSAVAMVPPSSNIGQEKNASTTKARSSNGPPPPLISGGSNVGIPSSLKSQIASMTPDASGAKPVEAAMSSIEPVKLPETTARELLAQAVDPEYPAAAKANGQRGGVVLQVLIGRDGAVQDAQFLQGSLVFARVAIEAVKQWRFRPYSLNGHAVAVQSTITLTFRPSA